eukprot:scaffold84315_cov34-Prasinocladus_malaysianus.AAC.2
MSEDGRKPLRTTGNGVDIQCQRYSGMGPGSQQYPAGLLGSSNLCSCNVHHKICLRLLSYLPDNVKHQDGEYIY